VVIGPPGGGRDAGGARAHPGPDAGNAPRPAGRLTGPVLVVDDEDLTLRTVSRGLRQEGFEVFTASSGEDALKVFAEEQPDLTLLDIVLPGIDGVEVLRRMKQANNAAIILMMSAYHMVDRAVEAMKLGAYDYLVKPFHLADLIATLQRATEMLAAGRTTRAESHAIRCGASSYYLERGKHPMRIPSTAEWR